MLSQETYKARSAKTLVSLKWRAVLCFLSAIVVCLASQKLIPSPLASDEDR
jgi:hypothetical protein